jgi:hypothetical protein
MSNPAARGVCLTSLGGVVMKHRAEDSASLMTSASIHEAIDHAED